MSRETIIGRPCNFLCPACPRRFAFQCRLAAHLRSHTNFRPFTCPDCGRAFTQRGYLVRHAAVHANERPFACTLCDRAYKHYGSLVNHRRTHTKTPDAESTSKSKVCVRDAFLPIARKGPGVYLCFFHPAFSAGRHHQFLRPQVRANDGTSRCATAVRVGLCGRPVPWRRCDRRCRLPLPRHRLSTNLAPAAAAPPPTILLFPFSLRPSAHTPVTACVFHCPSLILSLMSSLYAHMHTYFMYIANTSGSVFCSTMRLSPFAL
ncbi:unnamed protein product [Mesocestoides corti]|uniref:C2H2-type domain-containing protein n=1 Tax=Mesocestoides corti TaxID=53468 RepID=A0A3P6I8V7_MESCO|nr:unnamed protein product [Mesocestoides corti]